MTLMTLKNVHNTTLLITFLAYYGRCSHIGFGIGVMREYGKIKRFLVFYLTGA